MSLLWWFLVPASYLLGAVPWGLLVGKALKRVDVREYGSGRIGMSNVLRTVGVRGAILVVAGDVGKGVLPIVVTRLLTKEAPSLEAAVALAVLVGHNWSVFIRFHGGRGILTGLGTLLPLVPWAGAAAAVVGPIVIALTRYVSLGSLVGMATAVAVAIVLASLGQIPVAYLVYTVAGGGMILFQHRDNVVGLVLGTERRLGQRAETRLPAAGS